MRCNFPHGEGAKFDVLADTCREFAPAASGRVARAARLGMTSSSLFGVSALVLRPCGEVSRCLAVGILQRFCAFGRRDEMFFREKSKSPSIEAMGLRTSVRWAEVASHVASCL